MKIKFSPWLRDMINILWENREHLQNDKKPFDFPDYGGLPSRISGKLESDTVDLIQMYQDVLFNKCKTKKQFAQNLIALLFGEFASLE